MVDFIDAAQKGQYAALTTQFPSMVAHTLPPDHPGTEFAPGWCHGVGHLLHLNVLQRSTRLSELERAGRPGGAGAPGRRRPLSESPSTAGRPRVSLSASADPDGWHWMQYQPMKKRTALSTLGDEN